MVDVCLLATRRCDCFVILDSVNLIKPSSGFDSLFARAYTRNN